MNEGTPTLVPHEHSNDEVVTLIRWHVEDGQKIEAGQVVADVEGSKATFEVESSADGFLRRLAIEGEEISVGGILCLLFGTVEEAESWSEDEAVSDGGRSVSESESGGDVTRFSRRARQLVEQRELDVADFKGRGLVTIHDVQEFLGEGNAKTVTTSARTPSESKRLVSRIDVPIRREPLTPSKKTEARYIGSSYHNTLRSSVTVSVQSRGLKAAAQMHPDLEGNTTALIIYEAARLLRKYPILNGYHDQGEACIYEDINIGLAVDAGGGLKVPVIRSADRLELQDILEIVRDFLVSYLNDELTSENQSGGTFTVTDLSGDNVFSFEPLINHGQSAILGVGAESFPPGSKEGMFNLTLAFDHFMTEGRTAAQFLNDLRVRLQGHEEALMQRSDTATDVSPACARCFKPYPELRDHNHYLVQTVGADGDMNLVCTGCLQGW